jgi:hypothetical protein
MYLQDMPPHYLVLVRRAAALAITVLLSSCDGTVAEPRAGGYALRLVSPPVIRNTEALRAVAETLQFELLDPSGARVRQWTLHRADQTTGWLDVFDGLRWNRRVTRATADSSGIARLRWLPSDGSTQTLNLSVWTPDDVATSFTQSVTINRRATPLLADTVVTSGPESVCVLKGGRVGCMSPGVAEAGVHWLTFSAPVRSLSSTIYGSCALLTDGNTACWRDVGPDAEVRNDAGHPPFIEFRNSVGRTAAGALWKGVFASETGGAYEFEGRSWLPIPSDSTVVRLLDDENGLFVCGLTASGAVMCSSGNRVTPVFPGPAFAVTPFQLLRNVADSAVIRASGGYTTVEGVLRDGSSGITDLAVLRTTAGLGVRLTVTSNSGRAFYGRVESDNTLPSDGADVRSCVKDLDAECATGGAWRSVSAGGRLARVHLNVIEVGHRVICGVRGVIVCRTYIAGGDRLIPPVVSIDTVRVAAP